MIFRDFKTNQFSCCFFQQLFFFMLRMQLPGCYHIMSVLYIRQIENTLCGFQSPFVFVNKAHTLFFLSSNRT